MFDTTAQALMLDVNMGFALAKNRSPWLCSGMKEGKGAPGAFTMREWGTYHRMFVRRSRRQSRASNPELDRYVHDVAVLDQSTFHWRNDILNKFPKVVLLTRPAMNLHEA
jgi:hypothetical protein